MVESRRASWTGVLNFGLVSIPVRLFRAVQEHRVHFRYLHRECRTPLITQRYCPLHEEVIPWEEVARGYEIAPDQFVVVEEEDIERAAMDTAHPHRIDIHAFVDLGEVDPIYYDTSYYAEPRPEAHSAYTLLHQAMRQTARAGIATMALRARASLVAIRPYDNVIVVQRLYYADEVLSVAPLAVPREVAPPRELRTAIRLIENLAEPFAAQHFTDEYHRRLMSTIEERAVERMPAAAMERPPVAEPELLAELEASISAVQETRQRTP